MAWKVITSNLYFVNNSNVYPENNHLREAERMKGKVIIGSWISLVCLINLA